MRQSDHRFFSSIVLLLAISFLTSLAQAESGKTTKVTFLSSLTDFGAAEPYYQPAGANRTQIPFELIDNRPVFPVRLNGSNKVFRFILDTGSHMTVISTETAYRLGLRITPRGRKAAGVGGNFEVVDGVLWSCEIGKVRLDDVPVFIRPFLEQSYPVDGYIGLSFISRFVTSVDYGERVLTLERYAEVPESLSKSGSAIPIKSTSGGIVISGVRVEGIEGPLNFILDTGATVSVFGRHGETLPAISSCKRGERIRIIGAGGIEEDATTVFLPRLIVGSSEQQNILAVMLDLEQISRAVGSRQMGVLGGNFLRHFKVVLDLPHKVVRLLPLVDEKTFESRTIAIDSIAPR